MIVMKNKAIRNTQYAVRYFYILIFDFSSCRSLSVLTLAKADAFYKTTLLTFPFLILLSPFSLIPFPFCEAGSSTTVESALQIRPFLTNKPNFRKSQMSINKVLTKDYEKKTIGEHGKNKPNTNPIQTQSKPIQTQFKPKTKPNKANFYTIGSAFCLQLPLSAENLLRNFAYGYQ
jgi:hypothetical protein